MAKEIDMRIGEYFNYSFNFEFLQVFQNVIDGLDEDDLDSIDSILETIDSIIIYACDQWQILQFYCDPINADWNSAIEEFTNDVLNFVERYLK